VKVFDHLIQFSNILVYKAESLQRVRMKLIIILLLAGYASNTASGEKFILQLIEIHLFLKLKHLLIFHKSTLSIFILKTKNFAVPH